ncbi:phosphatidylinositol-specific phospholipase C [Clostridium botulinum]|uniref:phosphatidylinositol-specific phospholipase C n=1 Tax=Clostridium botulinum TaxID=1491 RepID=UPI000207586C|nr:phosphatidylinositol-specific phospholipase C [Clostridium botulinum]AEB77451.1 phosphatidylinositol-specific phospholipase C, X domain containing protein [Clostridium botulinum BKT015925]KEH96045.1 phosphatidylinositol-specific phospholipase C, catalytic domain [Clostridium botulinum C/D str. Sp77]KEH96968.1 phospholipase [Clostridium botulinum D str. 16868]MCD3198084.1 phosphatidylinositol-specific phospholipase C [Clostridium botulinum C/D]MCD3204432.1 phosphatidylinositol-specific phosp
MINSINYGYSHDNDVAQDRSQWMAKLNDNTPLSSLSIPGTHDTMALGWGGVIAETQSKSLKNQLISGIRYLDIRLGAYPNNADLLYSYHGFIYLHSTFTNILEIVTNFLKNNPSETIIMRIKQEHTTEADTVFISLLNRFFQNPKYSNYIYKNKEQNNPFLKELRGKILILQNFGGKIEWMPYPASFYIQDDYWLKSIWELYSKWEKVKDYLYKANQSFLSGEHEKFINYLSGTGGCFPYFVASGHVQPNTCSPQLPTGLIEPKFHSYYPDFPRVKLHSGIVMIFFQGTDILTMNYIKKFNPSYVGIIVADFPGQGLINSVIDVNFNKKKALTKNCCA